MIYMYHEPDITKSLFVFSEVRFIFDPPIRIDCKTSKCFHHLAFALSAKFGSNEVN